MRVSKASIGLVLFFLYLLQYAANVEFDYLLALQGDSTFRHWSGLVLYLTIISQWVLPIVRGVYDLTGKGLAKIVRIHYWLGIFSPLVFYMHSARPDYGLLLGLTVLFFLNFLSGFLINSRFFASYLNHQSMVIPLHIILSAVILALSSLHVWYVFYFN